MEDIQPLPKSSPAASAAATSSFSEPPPPRRNVFRRHEIWTYFGPAFVASVAYIDPGNFATNILGGSQFGYRLLWVLLWSNAMAILIQYLSAKLGIVTSRTLPQNCRDHFSPANRLGALGRSGDRSRRHRPGPNSSAPRSGSISSPAPGCKLTASHRCNPSSPQL